MPHYVIDKIVKRSPHLSFLKKNTLLLALHGSRAYGTNVPESDEDFKGISVGSNEHYNGFVNSFEQAELNDPDTVIYEVKKFFKLASDCNPNIMEMLFSATEDQLYVSKLGEIIVDNRDMFLSKRARFSFSGYAISQLKKIKLKRGYLLNPPSKEPLRSDFGLPDQNPIPTNQLTAAKAAINKELDKLNFKFLDHLDNAERIEVRNCVTDLLTEFKIHHEDQYIAMAKKIGFNDNVIEILKQERAYDQAKKEWNNYKSWKQNRNKKRAADEDKFGFNLKHAYHLIRLMRMCKEILTTGKVLVKRPDHEELLAIRKGAWSYEKLVTYAEAMEEEIKILYDTSTLPHKPNLIKLNQMCMNIVECQLNL